MLRTIRIQNEAFTRRQKEIYEQLNHERNITKRTVNTGEYGYIEATEDDTGIN